MALFNTLDLTHWSAWGYLLLTWKHKYSLPTGCNPVVFVNSVGARGKVVINGVKQRGVDVAWTLIFCFQVVTQEWISSIFKISGVFWIAVLSLFSSWNDKIVCDKLVVVHRYQHTVRTSCTYNLKQESTQTHRHVNHNCATQRAHSKLSQVGLNSTLLATGLYLSTLAGKSQSRDQARTNKVRFEPSPVSPHN